MDLQNSILSTKPQTSSAAACAKSTAELWQLYESGLSLAKIAAMGVGIGWGGIQRRFYRAGLKLRPKSGARSLVPIEKIVHLYFGQGLSLAKVASAVGFTRTGIAKKLVRAGYELRKRGGPVGPRVSAEEVIRLYDSGLSCKKIGELISRSESVVRARLRRAGHKKRSNLVSVPVHEAVRLYEGGLSVKNVGKRLGVSTTAIRDRFQKIGYQLRGKGPSPKKIALDELANAYKVGEISFLQACERQGISETTAKSRLKARGLLRSRSEASFVSTTRRIAAAKLNVKELEQKLENAKAEVAALEAKLGRPPSRAEDQVKYGPRIWQLKRVEKKSWGKVTKIMNSENPKDTRTVSGWRKFLPDTAPGLETSL